MTVRARVAMHPASTKKPGLTVTTIEAIVKMKKTSTKALNLYELSSLNCAHSLLSRHARLGRCDLPESSLMAWKQTEAPLLFRYHSSWPCGTLDSVTKGGAQAHAWLDRTCVHQQAIVFSSALTIHEQS